MNITEPRPFLMKAPSAALLEALGGGNHPIFTKEQMLTVCHNNIATFFSNCQSGAELLGDNVEPDSFAGIQMAYHQSPEFADDCAKAYENFENFLNDKDGKIVALCFQFGGTAAMACFCASAILDDNEDGEMIVEFGTKEME